MAIEKAVYPPQGMGQPMPMPEMEIEIEPETVATEDGGVIIDFDPRCGSGRSRA